MLFRSYSMEMVPDQIDDWYKRAQKFQTQYEHAKEVENRRKGTAPIFRPLPSSSTPAKDPNAMDVDVIRLGKLSQEEREKCFKQGLCFRCRKPRHNSHNCKTFSGNRPQTKVRKVEEEAEEAKDFDGEVEAVRRVAFSITKDF